MKLDIYWSVKLQCNFIRIKRFITLQKLFGKHPHLCIRLLNSLLPLKDNEPIETIEFLPAELVPAIPLLKRTIVDVRCKDTKGRQFIVEMQMYTLVVIKPENIDGPLEFIQGDLYYPSFEEKVT